MNDPGQRLYQPTKSISVTVTNAISLSGERTFVLTGQTGRLTIKGLLPTAAEKQRLIAELAGRFGSAPPPPKPPDILWTWIARLIMSPSRFIKEWLPQLADMHYLYDKCLKQGDKWGARRAIVHAHFYTVPRSFWGGLLGIFVFLLHHYWH